jgi:hypothetical protein
MIETVSIGRFSGALRLAAGSDSSNERLLRSPDACAIAN